ncbi:hypothetical protein ACTMTF_47725 [Nonomuraea sp. ZG12]|uniref:hypothetical protein n=1 Tax=Nonomuraea sp. ZG12 TaxID=3452207 RepID=UPI003F8CD0CF
MTATPEHGSDAQQPPAPKEPDNLHQAVRTPRQLRAALRKVLHLNNKTYGDLNIPGATLSANMAADIDKLPTREFVERYLQQIGLATERVQLWLEIWDWLKVIKDNPGRRRPRHPAKPAARPLRGWLSLPAWPRTPRRRVTVLVMAPVLLLAGGGWIFYQHSQQCWSSNSQLQSRDEGCIGVTDGRDGAAVFGAEYETVLGKIAEENRRVTAKPDGYVTIAFVGLMRPPSDDRNSVAAADPASAAGQDDLVRTRTLQQVEGAYTAQVAANRSRDFPKIRLVLANMGPEATYWREAVTPLTQMTDAPDRLVAAVGMGLSQQESLNAARLLSAAKPQPIPMVADIITADGFNATGTIDGRGPIPGLVRTAIDNTTQLTIIGKELRQQSELKTAALVWAEFTSQGTADLYTRTLKEAFLNPKVGLKDFLGRDGNIFRFDPRGGDSALRTISDVLCGDRPDMVFYAGRQQFLPTFLKMLHNRPCRSTPITVIAGSETTGQRHNDSSLGDPEALIKLIYVPLADTRELDSPSNPDRGLYQEFAAAFTSHGFPAEHLLTGWAALAHDATVTATYATHKASTDANGKQRLPTTHDVSGQLFLFTSINAIRGATGIFRIDPSTGNRIDSRSRTPVRLP